MHVGLLAPPWIPIPPPAYGGIEEVVALLARGLAARGHEVTLAAAAGSHVDGVRVIAPLDRPPPAIGEAMADWSHALPAAEALRACDVVIDHSGPAGALLAAQGPGAAAHVVHGPLGEVERGTYAALLRRAPALHLVAISADQAASAPELPFAAVCHNGLDVGALPYRAEPGGYLLFLGRISPDKGVADAIRIARDAGLPLRIAAKCREPEEERHFAEVVEPAIGPGVEWLGEVGRKQKAELLAGARALVFPIAWREPFGMVMVESMACGTPVLATPLGAVPEVVRDGVTGFLRPDAAGLAEAARGLGRIDRAACRAHVAERFSADALTDGYERLLSRLAGAAPLARFAGRRRLRRPAGRGRPARGEAPA